MKTLRSLLLLATPLVISFGIRAQNTGPVNPTYSRNEPATSCGTCVGAIWNIENNANMQDNIYTDVLLKNYLNCFQSNCYRSRYLYCQDFNFSIPANATVDGIKVKIRGKCSSANACVDSTIKLAIGGFLLGTNAASSSFWSTSSSTNIYGDQYDLWGGTWTPALVNDTSFGVFVKVYNTIGTDVTALIDMVNITIYYTLTTGTYSQTSSPASLIANYEPGQQQLNVNAQNLISEEKYTLQVFDLLGNVVFAKETGREENFSETISTSSLKAGIYFVSLTGHNSRIVRKVVIQ